MLPSRSQDRAPSYIAAGLGLAAFIVAVIALVAASVGTTSSSSSSSSSTTTLNVVLSDYKITPSTLTAPAGKVVVNLKNTSSQPHNFSIPSLNITSKNVDGGSSGSVDLGTLKPGTYPFICAIPGHAQLGMKGTLTVTEGGSGTAAGSGMNMSGSTSSGTSGSGMDPQAVANGDITAAQGRKMSDEMQKSLVDYVARVKAGKNVDKGNQLLQPTVLADGTKQFKLTAEIVNWEVKPGQVVKAWTYNGVVPAPKIAVNPGDKVQMDITNKLPVDTDIHWHGIETPNDQDGVCPLTQDCIKPGQTYTYKFTTGSHPQLGMYHAHLMGAVAVVNGMMGIFQVGEAPMPKTATVSGYDTSNITVSQEVPMVINDAGNIGLSINGHAFPETQPVVAKNGDWVEIQYANEGLQGHPMHLHGFPQIVIAKDGYPIDSPYAADTIWVGPGERYTTLVHADRAGVWAFHCHILTHAESDNGMIGMVTAMIVQ